MHIERAGI